MSFKLYILIPILLRCFLNVARSSILNDSSYGYLLPSPLEVAVWWCKATWKVGRERPLPQATTDAILIEAARNESFQIILNPTLTLSNVTAWASDLIHQEFPSHCIPATNVDVLYVDYVPVDTPSDSYCTPWNYPDPIIPFTSMALPNPVLHYPGSNQPLWVTIYIPKHALPGYYRGNIFLSASPLLNPISIPVMVRVFRFGLPDTTHTRTAYYVDVDTNGAPWHKLTSLEQKRIVWDMYMENYRRHRVSPYSPHLYAQITWTQNVDDFQMDFTAFDQAMERYLDEFGPFCLMWHKSPPIPQNLGEYAAFTPEYRQLFSRLMDKIMQHLREMGWQDKAYCYVVDKPRDTAKFQYLVDAGTTLLECAPGLPRLAAFVTAPPSEFYTLLTNMVDIWVPVSSLVLDSRFENQKGLGKEVWWYVCVGPASPYPNYYIDQPAIHHRIRFWMCEKYNIEGDLYYAVNQWSGRNPWTQTRTWDWSNANGDGTLIYPPTREPPTGPLLSPPINSIRFELIREGLEDLEYFWLLKELIAKRELELGPNHWLVVQARSIRENALALITNLHDLYQARRALAQSIEDLDTGAPWFIRHPSSRAASLGQTIKLYSEALGWPPPRYQWQRNGIDLPGETNAVLTITNLGPQELGDYRVIACNEIGCATNSLARVRGRWLSTPQILTEPQNQVKYEGTYAVLSVTTVSTNPCFYQWFKDGFPLTGPYSTNSVLLLTNLTWQHSGCYTVLVSNAAGTAIAGPAKLIVLWSKKKQT